MFGTVWQLGIYWVATGCWIYQDLHWSIRVLSNLLSRATPIMTLHLLLFMSNPWFRHGCKAWYFLPSRAVLKDMLFDEATSPQPSVLDIMRSGWVHFLFQQHQQMGALFWLLISLRLTNDLVFIELCVLLGKVKYYVEVICSQGEEHWNRDVKFM